MSRDPRGGRPRRATSPRRCGGYRSELGLAQTPLEVPDDEWSAASGAVDFGDTALRGPTRSRIEREDRRKTRGDGGIAALVRDEETEFTTPAPAAARRWRGSLAGVSAAVLAIAGLVVALFATGVL